MESTEKKNLEHIGPRVLRADRPFPRYEYARRRELMRRLLAGVDRRGSAVDLGCGDGRYGGFLRDLGFGPLSALDLSAERAKEASQNGFDLSVCASGQRTPYPDCTFDLVLNQSVLVNVLEPGDRQAMLTEAWRILRPGGCLLVSFPPREGRRTISLLNRLLLIEWLKGMKDRKRAPGRRPKPDTYSAPVSSREMLAMLRRAGFEPLVSLGHLYLYPEPIYRLLPVLRLLDNLLHRAIPYRGNECFLLARKPENRSEPVAQIPALS